MHDQWDREEKAFLCYFTGLPLTDAPGSRRSLTWEHLIPGDPWKVVLAADLVNKMKANMTEAEFKKMVLALAEHFAESGKPFDREAFPTRSRSRPKSRSHKAPASRAPWPLHQPPSPSLRNRPV
jgi:hypothetical protein